MAVKLALGKFLQTHNISVYRLHRETAGDVARQSIYNMANKDNRRVDLDSLEHVLTALSALLQRKVELQELFEVELPENPQLKTSPAGVPYTGDPETDEVLDTVPDVLKRMEELADPNSKRLSFEDVFGKKEPQS